MSSLLHELVTTSGLNQWLFAYLEGQETFALRRVDRMLAQTICRVWERMHCDTYCKWLWDSPHHFPKLKQCDMNGTEKNSCVSRIFDFSSTRFPALTHLICRNVSGAVHLYTGSKVHSLDVECRGRMRCSMTRGQEFDAPELLTWFCLPSWSTLRQISLRRVDLDSDCPLFRLSQLTHFTLDHCDVVREVYLDKQHKIRRPQAIVLKLPNVLHLVMLYVFGRRIRVEHSKQLHRLEVLGSLMNQQLVLADQTDPCLRFPHLRTCTLHLCMSWMERFLSRVNTHSFPKLRALRLGASEGEDYHQNDILDVSCPWASVFPVLEELVCHVPISCFEWKKDVVHSVESQPSSIRIIDVCAQHVVVSHVSLLEQLFVETCCSLAVHECPNIRELHIGSIAQRTGMFGKTRACWQYWDIRLESVSGVNWSLLESLEVCLDECSLSWVCDAFAQATKLRRLNVHIHKCTFIWEEEDQTQFLQSLPTLQSLEELEISQVWKRETGWMVSSFPRLTRLVCWNLRETSVFLEHLPCLVEFRCVHETESVLSVRLYNVPSLSCLNIEAPKASEMCVRVSNVPSQQVEQWKQLHPKATFLEF